MSRPFKPESGHEEIAALLQAVQELGYGVQAEQVAVVRTVEVEGESYAVPTTRTKWTISPPATGRFEYAD
jgi:hypothetical protein